MEPHNRAIARQDAEAELSPLVRAALARTPARIFVGRAGCAYRTATQLDLRRDHAAAVDAVHGEIDLVRDFGQAFIEEWQLFEVATQARDKAEYLLRPDLGRRFSEAARSEIARRCPPQCDFQVIIGDGLSAAAVIAQVPGLLPLLGQGARKEGWSFGQVFFVRHCRVGVLNEVGELLRPAVAVLLVGERPGLATAESLSAYMAYLPAAQHADANRNLISNIHARGVGHEIASQRVLALAKKMRQLQISGVSIKEDLPALKAPATVREVTSERMSL